MDKSAPSPVPARVTAAFIFAGFVAAVAVNWPGHLSYDSIVQLLEGRTGLYNTWHPPVMAWLLGMFDTVVPGTGLFVLFDAVLAFGALAAVLRLGWGQAGWPAAGIAAAFVLSPQLLLYQGLVWKDVLFADAAVAGFAALAWWAARRHWRWLAASLTLLVLAALTRQNGVVLLPFAGAGAGWIAARGGWAKREAALLGASALAVALFAVFAVNALLGLRSNGDSGPQEQLHVLQVYDLSAAAARGPAMRFDILADDDPGLEQAIRGDGARYYTPLRNDPVVSAPAMQAALLEADTEALEREWERLVTRHPWLYLKIRAMDFAYILFTPDVAQSRPVFVGVEGPAKELAQLGIAPRHDARDAALERYGKAFFGTPVFSHIFFALIAGLSLWGMLRRGRPADIALSAMLGGAFAFAASFFVIAISCDYRYLYLLDLSAMTALLYLAADRRTT